MASSSYTGCEYSVDSSCISFEVLAIENPGKCLLYVKSRFINTKRRNCMTMLQPRVPLASPDRALRYGSSKCFFREMHLAICFVHGCRLMSISASVNGEYDAYCLQFQWELQLASSGQIISSWIILLILWVSYQEGKMFSSSTTRAHRKTTP